MRSRVLCVVVVMGFVGCTHEVPPCFGTSEVCEATCVNLMEDQLNCGACGHACGAGTQCSAGTCATSCMAGLTMCDATCRDVDVDLNNCGACGNACGPVEACEAGTCVLKQWEALATSTNYFSFVDFTPSGEARTFTMVGAALSSFSFPTSTDPVGTFTPLAAAPLGIDEYSSLAWGSGPALYMISYESVLKYDIAQNMWTTILDNTLTHGTGDAAISADDQGIVYAWSGDQNLIVFDPAASSASYVMGPTDLPHSEPRIAWDSATKRLYMGDYHDMTAKFYAYNPVDQSFTPLPAMPGTTGFSDAFCSDRRGHIFTATGDGTNADVHMYTAATAMWTTILHLPWTSGDSAACSVSDGYLYFLNGNTHTLARLDVSFASGTGGAP